MIVWRDFLQLFFHTIDRDFEKPNRMTVHKNDDTPDEMAKATDKRSLDQKFLLKWTGAVLSFLGILLAVYSVWEASKQSEELQKTATRLDEIFGYISTKPVKDVDEELLTLLRSAEARISAISVYPSFAGFSKPAFFAQYDAALKAVASRDGGRVTVIYANESYRSETLDAEFLCRWRRYKSQDKDEYCDREPGYETAAEFENKLARYAQRFRFQLSDGSIDSYETLKALLLEHDRLVASEPSGVTYIETQEAIPIEAWIVDGSRAYFQLGTGFNGVGNTPYTTNDPALIKILEELVTGYELKASSGARDRL